MTSARWLPALVLLAALPLVVLPLAVLLAQLLATPDALWTALAEPGVRQSWFTGLAVSLGAAAVSTLLAIPVAVLTVRTDLPGASALSALCRLPLALPSYLLAMAWLRLWAPHSGLLQHVGLAWDLGSPWACALILGVAELPVVLLPLQSALKGVDPATEEAARIFGARPLRALWDASLRPSLPALFTGASLACASALAAFGVPLLLGSNSTHPFSVLTTTIYQDILQGTPASRASALALAFYLGLTSGAVSVVAWLLSRRAARPPQGKPQRPRVLSLGAWRWPLALMPWGTVAALLLVPLAALAWSSLLPHAGSALTDVSLDAHTQLASRRGLWAAVVRSVVLASGAAAACTALGLLAAVPAQRSQSTLARGVAALLSVPYMLPGTVLALAILAAYARPVSLIVMERITFTLWVAGTSWLLLFAWVAKFSALALRPVSVALAGVGTTLDEAARISGAGPWRAFITGTLPALRGVLSGGAITVMLLSFTELTMSVLLVGPDTEVLGTVLFELHSYASPAESAALATWMTFITLVGFALLARRSQTD
jgi:iron(III) transport system permease protein